MKMFAYLKQKIRELDYFGASVTLKFGGEDSFNTFCGGLVTILIVIGVSIESVFTYLDVYRRPEYNQLPITYDYDY
jgi:hypothetical protein